LRYPQDLERALLESAIVDADAPAAELVAVDDEVVLRAPGLARIGLHQRSVLGGERTGEGVVGERPSALRRSLEHRETVDPHGVMRGLVGKAQDRKSTRLNSSHVSISYAVFCLKKKRHV